MVGGHTSLFIRRGATGTRERSTLRGGILVGVSSDGSGTARGSAIGHSGSRGLQSRGIEQGHDPRADSVYRLTACWAPAHGIKARRAIPAP